MSNLFKGQKPSPTDGSCQSFIVVLIFPTTSSVLHTLLYHNFRLFTSIYKQSAVKKRLPTGGGELKIISISTTTYNALSLIRTNLRKGVLLGMVLFPPVYHRLVCGPLNEGDILNGDMMCIQHPYAWFSFCSYLSLDVAAFF